MDNVIVKDNKASRESLATGNSEITRTLHALLPLKRIIFIYS